MEEIASMEELLVTPDQMQLILQRKYEIVTRSELPNGSGTQFRLSNNAIVNVFKTGKYNVQGKNSAEVQTYIQNNLASFSDESASVNKNVFVVYGHDQNSRNQLELLLRRFDLIPLILDQLPSGGQTIIEKLEANISRAHFGIILATADDEGYRRGHPEEKMFRVRQNVILEMGMLLTRLGRDRVFILLQDQENLERPSDIQGLIYIPFKEDLIKEAGPLLARELEKLGIMIPASALT
jgi:predicted nucleotide-binding protein